MTATRGCEPVRPAAAMVREATTATMLTPREHDTEMVSNRSELGGHEAGMGRESGRCEDMIVGTISRLTQVPGGLLVEVAAVQPPETSVTLVCRLSAGADQAQVAWYEQMRETGTELRFQCSRSAPFTAPRIEQAGPSDDPTWLETGHGSQARVARSLAHATEVLRRVDERPASKPIGERLERRLDAFKRHE